MILLKNLNFYEIYVPALSERIQDKFDLINIFINEIVTKKDISIKNISKDFYHSLWILNVSRTHCN